MAERTTSAARDILGMQVCGVFLVDEDGSIAPAATTPKAKTLFDELHASEPDGGTIGEAFETGEPIVRADVPDHLAVHDPDTPVRSELVFPLGDHGVFVACATETDSFGRDDVSTGWVLAANARVTLDRIARENELREQKRRIEALHEVAAAFKTCSTEDEIYRLTLEAAEDLLDFSICVVDKVEGETLRGMATSSEMPPNGYYEEKSIHEGIYGKTYRTGETQLIDDLHETEEADPAKSEYRSVLSVPIGEFGVFQAVSERRGAFDEADRELAELLLTHVVEALRRAHREQAVRELHTATRELIFAETTEEVATIAVETAREMLDLPLTSIQLYDDEDDVLRPAAYTDAVADLLGEVPDIEPGNSIIWRVFSTGEPEIHDDVREDGDVMNPETKVRSQIILPLGNLGVLICNSTEIEDFDTNDVTLAKVLAENTNAALERTERERLLRVRKREIERQNEHLERFASVVSHDLRNPLNVASGHLETARTDCESEHLDEIAYAHARIEELIDDVLTLARHGRSIGELGPVSLQQVVTEAWSNAAVESATLAVADDLPVIYADGTRLQELLENLLRNAVDHAGSDVTVTIGRLSTGFYIEDDGPGIPEDERERVFEWGHSTADDGTGLGLSIVGQIAEAHGWEVAATESTRGGARFEVTGVESA